MTKIKTQIGSMNDLGFKLASLSNQCMIYSLCFLDVFVWRSIAGYVPKWEDWTTRGQCLYIQDSGDYFAAYNIV